jgi:aspartate carbamoyltransferase catalytic subunit
MKTMPINIQTLNSSRIALINKKFSEGLSETEELQLATLQAEMSEYVNRVHPLPFERLAELERDVYSKQEGLIVDA